MTTKGLHILAILLALYTLRCPTAQAQSRYSPLYIVNGVVRESVVDIPEEDIEHIETLPANEQNIERYGERARNGVFIISLCYDVEAVFSGGESFDDYIADHVKWPAHHPVERVALRYTVEADGSLTVGATLQATSRRLLKRVLSAIESAPKWQPATKAGKAVASQHVLCVQLPKGKPMPRERYVVIM